MIAPIPPTSTIIKIQSNFVLSPAFGKSALSLFIQSMSAIIQITKKKMPTSQEITAKQIQTPAKPDTAAIAASSGLQAEKVSTKKIRKSASVKIEIIFTVFFDIFCMFIFSLSFIIKKYIINHVI